MRFKVKIILIFSVFITFTLLLIIIFNSICFNDKIVTNDCDRKSSSDRKSSPDLPVIYIITPTFDRLVQRPELIRLSHTLLLLKNIHWILVEDSKHKTETVTKFLNQIQTYGHLSYTHLNVGTPEQFKMKSTDPNWLKPRGVLQRNEGLNWIRNNANSIDRNGVLYFADDDNTYDLRLFDEIRFTTRVSVFPVGLVGGLIVEKPVVRNGKVLDWNTMWKKERKFPIDMSGFAINIKLILDNPNASFSLRVSRGYQETHLLKSLVNSIDELEPKANNCTQILVWHTRTQSPDLKQELKLKTPSNTGMDL
jgi:galactosylgalactosylxylosylprotein 3-beta-glucuronosyltransferase 3